MSYVSVTVVSNLDHPLDYIPRTAVFSNHDKARAFKQALEAMFEKYGQADCYNVSIDIGRVNSDSYLEVFEMELSDDMPQEEEDESDD